MGVCSELWSQCEHFFHVMPHRKHRPGKLGSVIEPNSDEPNATVRSDRTVWNALSLPLSQWHTPLLLFPVNGEVNIFSRLDFFVHSRLLSAPSGLRLFFSFLHSLCKCA